MANSKYWRIVSSPIHDDRISPPGEELFGNWNIVKTGFESMEAAQKWLADRNVQSAKNALDREIKIWETIYGKKYQP